jgi:tRNA threonylcarbamoyladenosine biosynthesis protein TsaB
MLVFGFDTSLSSCSAAIVDGDETLWTRTKNIEGGQAEELPVMVAEALSATALTMRNFDVVAVTTGPGTFAGVRVGVAFARALTLGVGTQSIGVSTLTAIAAAADCDEGFIAPIVDARRGQVYAALLTAELVPVLPPFVATPADCLARLRSHANGARLSVMGPGAHLLGQDQGAAPFFPIDPVIVAKFASKAEPPFAKPTPLYLRPPDAAPSRRLRSSSGV